MAEKPYMLFYRRTPAARAADAATSSIAVLAAAIQGLPLPVAPQLSPDPASHAGLHEPLLPARAAASSSVSRPALVPAVTLRVPLVPSVPLPLLTTFSNDPDILYSPGGRRYDPAEYDRVTAPDFPHGTISKGVLHVPFGFNSWQPDDFPTLRGSTYIRNYLVNSVLGLLQLENIERCSRGIPQPDPSLAGILESNGANRLPRVVFINMYTPRPSAHGEPLVWEAAFFYDLREFDIFCIPQYLRNHFNAPTIDLRGQCAHYYDSIKGYFVDEGTLILKGWLRVISVLADMFGYDEFRGAENWPIHVHAGEGSGMPVQIQPHCACYATLACASIARGVRFNFSENDMPNMRMQMCYALLHWQDGLGEVRVRLSWVQRSARGWIFIIICFSIACRTRLAATCISRS